MPRDWYESFEMLSANEVEGLDFRVFVADRESDVLIMAPHGGHIEPGTSEIASAIARTDYLLYLFEGMRRGRKHNELHITSHKFDEPNALKRAQNSSTLVALHGRADRNDEETVWLGGLDEQLADKIVEALIDTGFKACRSEDQLAGSNANNICNRNRTGRGAQLEIPRTLRDRLVQERQLLVSLSDAVRQAITAF